MARRISRGPLVEATAASLESSLPKARTGRCQARRLPVVVVISMECALLDESLPDYWRFLSGVELAKVWGCLRYDDTRGINPAIISSHGRGVEFVMDRTKTSAMSKEEQRGDVHKGCNFSGNPWFPKFLEWLVDGAFRVSTGLLVTIA